MSPAYKLMLAVSAACCIGPFAFLLWMGWELGKLFAPELPSNLEGMN